MLDEQNRYIYIYIKEFIFNFFYRAHIRSEVAANNCEGSVNVSSGLGNQKQDVVEFDIPIFNELKFSHLFYTNDNCDDSHAV